MSTNKNLVSVTVQMAYWESIVDEYFKRIKEQNLNCAPSRNRGASAPPQTTVLRILLYLKIVDV